MSEQVTSINIGYPVAWMLDPRDDTSVLGITYAFSVSGERMTVWYTDSGEPAGDFRLVSAFEVEENNAAKGAGDPKQVDAFTGSGS